MVSLNEIEILYKSTKLVKIESEICSLSGCLLYSDNQDKLAGYTKEEIELSKIEFIQIKEYIENYSGLIIEFAMKMDLSEDDCILCKGFSITYVIYLIYLQNYSEEELMAYLKKRMPDYKDFFNELMSIKKELNLDGRK